MPTGLLAAQGAVPAALGGIKMVQTASIYRLSRVSGFQVPIEPLIDLIPGITPARVTMDLIDSEDVSLNYTVTENTLQDFSNTTSNVHRELQRISITGVMASTLQTPLPLPIGPATTGSAFVRFDLLRIANLEAIANRGEPVMVVTPRFSLARCFIESISRPWSPDIGPNTELTISCVEARILSPGQSNAIPNYGAQLPGNGTQTGGGNVSPTVTNSPDLPFNVPGVAPA
jgi:hypothetical protein